MHELQDNLDAAKGMNDKTFLSATYCIIHRTYKDIEVRRYNQLN